MTQADALYQLQQIDLTIVRAQKRLDEITAQLGNSDAVVAAQQHADAAAKALSPLRTKVRDLELEIQSAAEKAKATEQQLYSGSVKNPKAMQEMEQELAGLKKRQSELEDRLLEGMMTVEEAQAAVDDAQAKLAQARRTAESGHAHLLIEQADLQGQVAQMQLQRQTALKPIEPESLKLYNSLRRQKANQPMSLLNGVSCTLCGIEQTMNVVQDVRHGDKLTPCTNCGRLLVYKPGN